MTLIVDTRRCLIPNTAASSARFHYDQNCGFCCRDKKGRKRGRMKPVRQGGQLSVRAQQDLQNIPFEVIKAGEGQNSYELRFYQPRFIVEMPYKSRQTAYMEFDKYLTGSNEDGIHLEAFSPVIMRHDPNQGTKTMQMFVRDLGSLRGKGALELTRQPPLPKGNHLSLNIAGGEVVAVLTFSGQATREITYQSLEKLRQLLEQDGIKLADAEGGGVFSLAQYDPVHSLKERSNELWLAVAL